MKPSVALALRSIILAIAIIAAAIFVFLYMKNSKPSVPAEPFEEKPWTVSVFAVDIANASPQVVLFGAVESGETVQLSATVNAFVKQVMVAEGDYVQQGDTLVVLDDRELALNLAQREASLKDIRARIASQKNRFELAKKSLAVEQGIQDINTKNLERQKVLVGNNMAAASRVEDAERAVKQQQISLLNRANELKDHPNTLAQLEALEIQNKSQLALTKLDLERTRMTAPFTGRVLSINTAMGNRARNGDRLVSLYNRKKLEIRSQVPAKYLSAIRNHANLKAAININGQRYELTLDRLSAEASANQGGVDAYFSLPAAANIEIGRNVQLTIDLPSVQNVVAIPALSLYGQNTVYRVNDNRLEAIAVERIGKANGADGTPLTLVKSAQLQQGDPVIITQLPNAVTGLLVNVR